MKATLARLSRFTTDPLAAGDGPLLDAFLAGDQSAFAVLVNRHAGLVFATCRRVLRHQQDAEDAFQATFLVLARRAADVWPREAVGSWLFGVAHRVALKARAVRSRRTVREKPLEDVASAKQPPPDFDLAEVVHRVVCKLPEVYRAAVVACDLEGLSRKEAAERLGWSEGTLSGRLARRRELLATRLRRLGLALPAAGLAGLLSTTEAVSATTLQSTVDLATGAAGGVSAPVAALTEGVVRSMALFKFKAMAAVVFAACALGFGAFAAAGTGAGDGPPGQQTPTPTPTAPVAAKPADPPAKPLTVKPPAKLLTDRDRLRGSWRVVALIEGEKTTPTNPKDPWVIEFSGGTMRMPFRELEGGWKQREYSFSVDETQTLRTIDLIANQKPLGRGIYEFTLPVAECASCHVNPFVGTGAKLAEFLAVCPPVLKDPRKAADLGVRLALSIDGKRPTKFGGTGVIVFELRRPDALNPPAGPRVEFAQKELEVLLRELELAGKDTIAPEVLERLRAHIRATEALLAAKQPPPNAPDIRVATAALQKAQAEAQRAKAEAELARAEVAKAQASAAIAQKSLQDALDRLKAAEKAFNEASEKLQPAPIPAPKAKEAAEFTIHVRTMTAAEKVIRVKATGKETVADGLVYAGGDILTKPNTFTVWVLRDGTVMPVDLVALSKNADAKTDYSLKVGDQLFVQMKPGK